MNCHSTCELYIEFNNETQKLREENRINSIINGTRADNIARSVVMKKVLYYM